MSEHKITLKTYVLVYVSLMVLLALTVLVSLVHLGPFNLAMALLIASIKSVLVMLFFMHVRFEAPLVRIFAVAGFVWLIILLGLTMSDYLTRHLVL